MNAKQEAMLLTEATAVHASLIAEPNVCVSDIVGSHLSILSCFFFFSTVGGLPLAPYRDCFIYYNFVNPSCEIQDPPWTKDMLSAVKDSVDVERTTTNQKGKGLSRSWWGAGGTSRDESNCLQFVNHESIRFDD